MTCAALSSPDTMWNFCPSIGASVLFLILFLLTTGAHIYQAASYCKSYCWVIIMSGIWQVLTYIFRTASIKSPDSFGMYAAWFVLILVAPLWTNAFTYMVFGRLVWNQTNDRKVWGLKAAWFGAVFVILDIIAFIIQVYGAAQASSNTATEDVILRGLHVYMAGVGIQLLFILICGCFSVKLFAIMWANGSRNSAPMHLICIQFAVMLLIIIRIIFRIVEYSSGLDSSVPRHEAFQYCLDSLPMLAAIVLYNLVHPGRIFRGPETEMPSFWAKRLKRRKHSAEPAMEI